MATLAAPRSRPADLVANVGPNWFASVMGTGIIANALVSLPHLGAWTEGAGTAVWALATLWLLVVSAAFAAHFGLHREKALSHHANPVMMQFYGAPPMALMTVGYGFLLFAPPLIGSTAATAASAVLWTLGTIAGLCTTVAVPYLMFTRHDLDRDAAFAGWLMPVVPPMVSAATGAALIPHLPAGQAQQTLLVACYAMFGVSLMATLVILPQVWSRFAHHGMGAAATVPTMWIVLGPLGQSVTASGNLAEYSSGVVDSALSGALTVFSLVFGIPVLGFALTWIAVAALTTLHARRGGLPFALTWWSFTFPVGTCVTGAAYLAKATGLAAIDGLALLLYAFLLGAWATVAFRTVRGIRTRALLAG
ncbi:TDT family transporter [Salininema proteolyticum]|uniref:TDT family transporter n=1 Tax=Salininema proteolyticum TaxID=1607685 RepID=A0ABV8TWG5_9ACTN